jgi:type II secretory pathway predicted ATPase ExeA
MYKHFFGLRENPFNVNPDPRYLFLTAQTREALDEMTYGIQARKGLILLTGEVGTGKTTLINRLLNGLHQQKTPTAFIFNPHLETSHLFDFILADFGVAFDSRVKGNALMCLNQWLVERYRAGDTPVLIVDEAQGLPIHLLEEIRMLLNLETPHEKLLQIVLAGQPELEERLKRPDMRQLKQRIMLRCKTAALTVEETHDYILSRLQIAGVTGKPVFTSHAMDALCFYSRGIPRVVNLLCEHALINAYVDNVQPVPAHIIEEIAREFQFDDIKPLGPSIASGDTPGANLIAMQSTLPNATVHPSVAAEPFCQEQRCASTTGDSAPFDCAATEFGPQNEPASPILHCERIPVPEGGNETFGPLGVPVAPLAAPGPSRMEARQPSGSIACLSNARVQFIAELAMERTPPALSARLHVVEAKGKVGLLPASSRGQVPRPQKVGHPPSTVHTAISAPRNSGRMTLPAVRLSLTRWGARWRDLLLSAVTSQTWTRMTAMVLRGLNRAFRSVQALYRERPGWLGGCPSIVGSIEWPQMLASVYRWLRQPWNPTSWHLPDSRMFEARRRLSHKKT